MHTAVIAERLQLWCEFFATDAATVTDQEAAAGGFDVDELLYDAQRSAQPELMALAQRCQLLMDSWCEAQDLAEGIDAVAGTVH